MISDSGMKWIVETNRRIIVTDNPSWISVLRLFTTVWVTRWAYSQW
jgi:hypothetical protein